MKKKTNTERFEQLGTKIDPAMAEVLNTCCDSLQVDVYHLLQWFCYVIVKASSPMHSLDPRIQKLMVMIESDAGWQKAFNQANPDNLNIAQIILILEQEKHKGFGAVMIDKPFMSEARQTECVDDILERITEVTMQGIYKRLRLLGASLDCNNLSDVLLTLIDSQDILNAEQDISNHGPQIGEYTDNGRLYQYGKRTKRKQHRTPDSYAADRRIKFDYYDREIADNEVAWDQSITSKDND